MIEARELPARRFGRPAVNSVSAMFSLLDDQWFEMSTGEGPFSLADVKNAVNKSQNKARTAQNYHCCHLIDGSKVTFHELVLSQQSN